MHARDGYYDDAAATVAVTAAREFDSNLLTVMQAKLMQALGLPTNIRARNAGRYCPNLKPSH